MSILLKDLEELKKVDAQIYELDASKKYLILIPKPQNARHMETMQRVLEQAGIGVSIISGMDFGQFKMFELEHIS